MNADLIGAARGLPSLSGHRVAAMWQLLDDEAGPVVLACPTSPHGGGPAAGRIKPFAREAAVP